MCWAASLGNCGGGISREHIISASQFEETSITVEGLPWCREPRTVGLASLVAKNLCRDHNTALSPADNEARRLKLAFKTMLQSPILPVRQRFDARLVERWLLKTTINLALQEPGSGLDPTPEFVRYAFGQATPPAGEGFFFVAELGEDISYRGKIRFESVTRRDDGRMVIGAFMFHAIRILYAFKGAPEVAGAFRVRRTNVGGHWAKFQWNPELALDDRRMPGANG